MADTEETAAAPVEETHPDVPAAVEADTSKAEEPAPDTTAVDPAAAETAEAAPAEDAPPVEEAKDGNLGDEAAATEPPANLEEPAPDTAAEEPAPVTDAPEAPAEVDPTSAAEPAPDTAAVDPAAAAEAPPQPAPTEPDQPAAVESAPVDPAAPAQVDPTAAVQAPPSQNASMQSIQPAPVASPPGAPAAPAQVGTPAQAPPPQPAPMQPSQPAPVAATPQPVQQQPPVQPQPAAMGAPMQPGYGMPAQAPPGGMPIQPGMAQPTPGFAQPQPGMPPAQPGYGGPPAGGAPMPAQAPPPGPFPQTGFQPNPNIAQRIAEDPYELHFLDPYRQLPERVEFVDIPNISQTRSQWRLGIRKVQEAFADHIANMHMDFEAKTLGYEQVQRKIESNVTFLQGFYRDMQNVLNQKYRSIKIERDAWEIEREQIASMVKIDSEVVSLNVGGTLHIQTEKDVLRSVPNSNLAQLFSDMHELKKINDEVFLDRDGRTFNDVINYLRNDRKVYPEFFDKNQEHLFIKELHYWGIDSDQRKWQEQVLRPLDKSVAHGSGRKRDTNRPSFGGMPMQPGRAQPSFGQESIDSIPHEIVGITPADKRFSPGRRRPQQQEIRVLPVEGRSSRAIYSEDEQSSSDNDPEPNYLQQYNMPQSVGLGDYDGGQPGTALRAVQEKWSDLGPLKLEEIIQNSSSPVSQSLQFGQSHYNKFIIGQVGHDCRVQGVGKEINHTIYEGQFKNDVYHGYGRFIYASGAYYIGQWADGKRSGWGQWVDTNGKVLQGMWQFNKMIGQ